MTYDQQKPQPGLTDYIRQFWMIDSEGDAKICPEKIVPDGYPEMIFHNKQSFRTNIDGHWQLQDKQLIAGQISNFFYIENTGVASTFAIKLQPWALSQLFDIRMGELNNRVISISSSLKEVIRPIIDFSSNPELSFVQKVSAIETWFYDYINAKEIITPKGLEAVRLIILSKGETPLKEIQDKCSISERGLERFFKSHIGLTPKRYSRIIRFSNIFKLVQDPNFNWQDITFLSGFYDQSHFIKNFKEFTGEEPSKYGFDEHNLANLFLKN